MFSHILVPLDGSPLAERALPLATWIARTSHASISLVWCVPEVLPMSMYAAGTMNVMRDTRENEIESANGILEQVAAKELFSGIDVSTHVLVGDAAPQLLSYIHEQHVDLVVMCSHGRTGMTRWFLGSVAQEMVRRSTVPVLVIREDMIVPAMRQEEHFHPLRVLVSLDRTPFAETALLPAAQFCAMMAAPDRGALHLVSVLDIHDNVVQAQEHMEEIGELDEESGIDIRQLQSMSAWAYLQHIAQRFATGDLAQYRLNISLALAVDHHRKSLSEELVNESQCIGDVLGFSGCDMIFMATHGRTGFAHATKGSITEHVLDETQIPVFVVHPPHTTLAKDSLE